MATEIAARSFVLAWVFASVGLSGGLLRCQELPATSLPLYVTVHDLGLDPQKFDGHYVRVRAVLAFGWEGDDFLSDPVPKNLPSGSPAYLWFYPKLGREQQVYGQIRPDGRCIQAWFTGYFHFVSKPQTNGMYDPGHLQFEATNVSMPEPSGSLADAIGQGDVDKVREILRSGAQVNILDEHRSLPLFEAASYDRTDIVEELLAAGADPNLALDDGSTALIAAAFNRKVKIAKLLLDHGASVSAADAGGETALIMAPHNGSDGTMVQLLLDAGADPNSKTKKGMTSLISAAMFGDALSAEKLLKAGADPAVTDGYGNTAESASCDRGENGCFRVCQLVREALRNAATHSSKR